MFWVGMSVGLVVAAAGSRVFWRMRMGGAQSATEQAELRFELGEARDRIGELESEVVAARAQRVEALTVTREDTADEMAVVLASPIAFLATQAALLDEGQSPDLTVDDLGASIRRFLGALPQAGIELAGVPGESTVFDADIHQTVSGEAQTGQPVVVRVPAVVAPSGKVVRQALVDPS